MTLVPTHPAIPTAAPAAQSNARATLNALTIDVDDWGIAVLGPDAPLTDRVVRNTRRMVALLAEHNVRATFFVLGRVAAAYPEMVQEIAAAGHEVGSHGHRHVLITRQSPAQFRDDVARSMDAIAAATGIAPVGYRAPAFSIIARTRWAGPILASLGFRYSSSVFPFRGRRYGMADAPRQIQRWPDCDLIEAPPTTLCLAGRRWPWGGGGYARLLPGAVFRAGLRRVQRSGMPAILYFHPYELDVREIRELRQAGWRIPRRLGWMQSLFRSRTEPRLRRLLRAFAFAPLQDVIGEAV